jgi:2-dehydro-3-deoxygluconokinase
MRVACIGECMIELNENREGGLTRRFGGDTLNTALYLARLGMAVDFITALGWDDWSSGMIKEWSQENIGTNLVVRCADELPGLYVIQTDQEGERRFSYWRSNSAARKLFSIPETEHLIEALQTYHMLYYSGITLSIFDDYGRTRLLSCLQDARRKGAKVAFDTNFRTRGWPDLNVARAAFLSAVRNADVVFASSEDVESLFGDDGTTILVEAARSAEVVLKSSDPGCSILCAGCSPISVPAINVVKAVDTTAAGDSFAAAYLAARLSGRSPQDAALEGHRLASTVVLYPGAIIPLEAMPRPQ